MILLLIKKTHYLPEATVLIVAGAVTEKEVMNEVNKIFGTVSRGKKKGKLKVKEIQKKPAVLVKFKETDQTHFVLGVRSFGLFDKNKCDTFRAWMCARRGNEFQTFSKTSRRNGSRILCSRL